MWRSSGAPRVTCWPWPAWRDTRQTPTLPAPPTPGTLWWSSTTSKENTSTPWRRPRRWLVYTSEAALCLNQCFDFVVTFILLGNLSVKKQSRHRKWHPQHVSTVKLHQIDTDWADGRWQEGTYCKSGFFHQCLISHLVSGWFYSVMLEMQCNIQNPCTHGGSN